MVDSAQVSFGSAIEFVEEDLPRADLAQLEAVLRDLEGGLVELSRHLVRLRTGEDGWRICPDSLAARVPGKLTLTV